MTATTENATINGVYISVSIEKYATAYRVTAYRVTDGICHGLPLTETYYSDSKKAHNRFMYLRRQAKTGSL